MLNTIVLIIVSVLFIIYAMRVVNAVEHGKYPISDIIVFILAFGIIINACYTNNKTPTQTDNTYYNGYNAAIKSAELVEVNEDCYHIAFGNEVHCYER